MTIRRILAFIMLGFALLSGLYSWAVPPFEGPDGPQHYAYVTWLAEGKGLPPQGEKAWQTPLHQEASQPPLYYWLASLPVRLIDHSNPPAVFRANPHFPSNAPGTVPDNKNIAIHYPADTRPFPTGGWLGIYLARTVSVLCGIILIAAVFELTRTILPTRPHIALGAALLVALNPQVLFLSSVVSNDIAAAATGSITLVALTKLIRRGFSNRRALILGATLGIAILSKTSLLALALPVAVGLLWLGQKNKSWRILIQAGCLVGLGSLLLGGWWYLRSWFLYGNPLALQAHYLSPWVLNGETVRSSLAAEWLEVFYSFWAAFGWGNIKFPAWVYLPLIVLMLVAITRLTMLAWQRLRRPRRPLEAVDIAFVLLGLTVLVVLVALESWMQQLRAPHGRLIFPALGAAVVLLMVGWHKTARPLPWLALGYLGLLALLSPILLIHPAYAPPRGIDASELDSQSLGWRFGTVAELFSVTPLERSITAGQTLPIDVCWRPLAQLDRDATVMVHLVGPNNSVIARRYTYPGLGNYPTSQWVPGQLFCDRIPVDIPDTITQTLRYQVEIGLIDFETLERLPAVNADDSPLGNTFAQGVRIAPKENSPVVIPPATGSGAIQLLDYDTSTSWAPGGTYPVTLEWQLAEPIDQDLTVFIHLRDPIDNSNIAQADGPPVNGWYPTSWWVTGETVSDTHSFDLPEGIAPGRYALVIGWYDPLSEARLDDEIHLADIEIGK